LGTLTVLQLTLRSAIMLSVTVGRRGVLRSSHPQLTHNKQQQKHPMWEMRSDPSELVKMIVVQNLLPVVG
jgi:hypothetical protein